jgi:arylsulfatase A-like enzyme
VQHHPPSMRRKRFISSTLGDATTDYCYRRKMFRDLLGKRWPRYLLAFLLVGGYLLSLVEERPIDSRPIGTIEDIERLSERDDLNIMFVLIDTLRAERLGAWGYERDTSPTLDWIADSGIRFARHLSQSSWTKTSMASLWTGLYPQRTRVLRFNDVLSNGAVLPAEILRQAGYRTVGIWRNGWVAPNFGFGQGFDVYHRPAVLPLNPSERRKNPSMALGGSDKTVLEAVNSFLISAEPGKRWFLYLHLMDLHQYTYDADSALFGTSFPDIYDNSIRREDKLVNSLLGHLVKTGNLDNTIVVIASDHGEAFGERGFEGHAQNLFRETTEVPLIISLPFRLEPGVVVESRTRNIDLWPTMLDILGLPELEDVDGRSRLPAIQAAANGQEPLDDDEPSYADLDQRWGRPSEKYTPTVAVSLDDYRYMLWTKDGGAEALYDRRVDAKELTNVIDGNPEIVEKLRQAARSYLDESPKPPWGNDAPTVELDEMQLNQLRALGYEI